ncbi:MAG: hypothetical protein ACJ79K_11660 [Gemmatimonadaceae bacterium]
MAAPARTRPVSDSFNPLTPGVAGLHDVSSGRTDRSPRLRPAIASLATIAGLTMLLLLPAFFNGYPILFSDTADYLLRSETLLPSPIRAPGYAFWIRFTSAGSTLWLPVVAQAFFLAALLWQTLRAFGRAHPAETLGITFALTVGTSIAWVSSKAMPDVFVALVVLGLYLIACHWTKIGWFGRALSIAAVFVGSTMHLTNVLVGCAVLVVIFVLRRRGPVNRQTARTLTGATILLLASAVVTRGYESLRRDEPPQPFNGSMFVLSHLVETGLAQQLLQERCGSEQFALCPVRDTLTRSVDIFVWRPKESPRYFVLHDDPALIRAETSRLLGGIVRNHPLALAASVLGYTGRQLVAFRVNDEIWRHRHRTEVQRVIARMYPADLPAQEVARQQENTLRLPWTSMLHLVVFLACAAFSLVMLSRASIERELRIDNAVGLHVIVWVALIANAAICANLASVFSRYQSRVSWLLPFAVVITLLERGTLRWPRRSRVVAAA